MADLPPEKIDEIKALVLKSPPETAVRLLGLFERMQVQGVRTIPTDELLSAMREAGIAQFAGNKTGKGRILSFQRLFFEPFENLFEDGLEADMLPGALPRGGLQETWKIIIGRLAPDDYVELEPHGTAASLTADLEKARIYARKMRVALLENIQGIETEKLAQLATSPMAAKVLRRLPGLLTADEAGRHLWYGACGPRGELMDFAVAELCAKIRGFEDSFPSAAYETLMLIMAIMPRPCQAMRVLNKASRGVDDIKLDTTIYADVGRRILALATREGMKIEAASKSGLFDPLVVANAVEFYNQHSQGMTREANLAPNGPWRKALTALRSRVGAQLEQICQNCTKVLEQALPIDRVRKKNVGMIDEVRYGKEVDQTKLLSAECHLKFIVETRLTAPLAGFGGFRDNVAKAAAHYLDNVCESLVRIAVEDQNSPFFEGWTAGTVALVTALDGSAAGKIAERRLLQARPKAA